VFIERLQHYAMNRRVRISFLTGDAHSAAAGIFKTMKKDWDWRSSELAPTLDHRYMLSIVSSAVRSFDMLCHADPNVQVRLSTLRKLFCAQAGNLVFMFGGLGF
jgi:hypothetical protein